MRVRRLVPFVVALAFAASACATEQAGAGSSPAGTSAPPASPTAESPSPTETTASPTPAASPLIENGRNFAFIKSVDVTADPATVTYDLAYFLTGDQATKAAEEHGDESPPPNDYYIVNDNPKLRTVPLSPDVRLVLLDWNRCCDRRFRGDLADFARAFDEGELTVGDRVYKGNLSPYWLVAHHGVIVKIEEQYLP